MVPLLPQLEDDDDDEEDTATVADDEEEKEAKEKEGLLGADGEEEEDEDEDDDNDDDEECLPLADEGVEGVSPATRAKQLAVRLKQAARKVLRDLGRILAISLLALAGKSAHCPLRPGGQTAAH